MMKSYKGKILILGCGSVAQCTLAILFDLIKIDPSHITVIDVEDKSEKIHEVCDRGVHFVRQKVTRFNYEEILSSHLSKGDFLLDLSVGIDTCALIQWCHDHGVLFLNTSIEIWNKEEILHIDHVQEHSLYMRHFRVQELVKQWKEGGPTIIIEHGANPGLVSHFAKKALIDIANQLEGFDKHKKEKLLNAIKNKEFAHLGFLLGLKTIHISEIDTQIAKQKRKKDEFVNTWSCDGFIEEAAASAELGFGVHEEELPEHAQNYKVGLKHQILLKTRGCKTKVRSWVPTGHITGMIIRHGESYTLCEALSYYEHDTLLSRPTVHYAYQPCPDATASIEALEKNNWKEPEHKRIMSDEIISGYDELGCLLLGDFGSWWIGTTLDIDEARRLAPHQNATTVQVAISIVAGMIYAMEHSHLGFCVPDDLDHEFILKIATPYLGRVVSMKAAFNFDNSQNFQLTQLLLQEDS